MNTHRLSTNPPIGSATRGAGQKGGVKYRNSKQSSVPVAGAIDDEDAVDSRLCGNDGWAISAANQRHKFRFDDEGWIPISKEAQIVLTVVKPYGTIYFWH